MHQGLANNHIRTSSTRGSLTNAPGFRPPCSPRLQSSSHSPCSPARASVCTAAEHWFMHQDVSYYYYYYYYCYYCYYYNYNYKYY